MASSKTATPSDVAIPSTISVGSTTLAKVPLSYKWIINDAKIFFRSRQTLRSPEFPILLPSREYESVKTFWHLLYQKTKPTKPKNGEPAREFLQLSLCQGKMQTSKAAVKNEADGFLCDSDEEDVYSLLPKSAGSVLISSCVFSMFHPETNEVLFSSNLKNQFRCKVSESIKTCCTVQTIDYAEIKNFIFDKRMTVEVEATLLCVDNPIETFAVVRRVPLDNIRSEMHSLYKNKVFTDVIIKCGGKEFEVHKAILSQSAVFRTMFEVDMSEKRDGIVNVTDMTPAVMSDLVDFFYTGTVPNVKKLAKELLNAAQKYELPRLYAICEGVLKMRITVANVIDTIILADLHNATSLRQACLKFIHLNSAEVQKTSRWKYLKANLDDYGPLLIEIFEYKP